MTDEQQPIRAYVADELPIVREGLSSWLRLGGVDVVGTGRCVDDVLRAVVNEVDLLVIGHVVGARDGADVCRLVSGVRPGVRSLLVVAADSTRSASEAIDVGAGYVFADVDFPAFRHAVSAVLSGDGSVVRPRPTAPRLDNRPTLSERERALLRLLARGMSNREIAAELHVSVSWVKAYVSRLMTKLSARSRTEVVALAVRDGILDRFTDRFGERPPRSEEDVRPARTAAVHALAVRARIETTAEATRRAAVAEADR